MATTRRPDPVDFSGRDLRFRPVDPERASTLRAEDVEQYNVEGFLSGFTVFEPDEARATRDYIGWLLGEVVSAGDGRGSYSVNGYHTVCAGIWDIVTSPRVGALVADLLGPEAVCWGTHLFAKMPGDGKEVPFHQDAVYWPFTPTETTTMWLAIDDVGPDNAPVQFVPGSHLEGPIPHEVLELDGTRVLGRQATGMDRRPGRFSNELVAGQVSLHSDLLLHGSAANDSKRRRAGLTMRFAAAGVRVLPGYDDWRRDAIAVGQGDSTGYWGRVPRPDGDRPDLMAAWRDGEAKPVEAG